MILSQQPIELILIVNAFLLLLTSLAVLVMLRASVLYGRHLGDVTRQHRYRNIVLRIIILLIVIGLIASAFNLIFG